MTQIAELNGNDAETLPLEDFAERAYLEYAMYVILDRALPHIGDGLKPVQRRIVYAMSELGLKAGAKYKKSARTVGDVLGKFHPHGDMACYEAMVLMAQSFSCRYPLVDGQGNWGAPDDPKSFAAMRYTEARLSPYAEVLLKELNLGAVDWISNFDGTLKEPAILPARLPNILINGASGIAVGMATDIPPHNLREVAEACIMLLENPYAEIEVLCECIQGPDFPTKAEIITPQDEIIEIYRSGRGTIRTRAAWYRENGDIVVTALPHQVSGAKIIEQIAAQIQTKKLPMVSDIRDESDHEDPVRLVIVPRSNRIDIDALMAHLFATTDLEKTARVNMNLIGLNGRPKVRDLKDLLAEWITFRRTMVRKRLEYRLEQVLSRLHIIEGFLIAYMDIDAVVRIIRNTDHPKPELMKRFKLTEKQTDAILELRLRQLAKLEEQKLRDEQNALETEKDDLEKTLGSGARLDRLIKKELTEDAEKYGDGRRSPLVERKEAQAMSKAETLPTEPVTVVLTVNGWVRAAKGHDVDAENLNYKAGDRFLMAARGKNTQDAIFLDSTGRSYALPAYSLPSARSHGEPLSGRLNLPDGAKILTVLMGPPDLQMLLASDAGYGFVAKLGDLATAHRAGKAILTLPHNSEPLLPIPVASPETDLLAAITSEGRLLVFPVRNLPVLSKGKGNKIIGIPPSRLKSREEFVTGLFLFPPGSHVAVHAGKRRFTIRSESLEHYMGERGRRGRKLPRGFRRVDCLEITEPEQMEIL